VHSTRRPMRYVAWSGSSRKQVRTAIGIASAVEAILHVGSSPRILSIETDTETL
jgi:hypothetical protein